MGVSYYCGDVTISGTKATAGRLKHAIEGNTTL